MLGTIPQSVLYYEKFGDINNLRNLIEVGGLLSQTLVW